MAKSTGDVVSAPEWNTSAYYHGVMVTNTANTSITTGADRAVPLDAEDHDTDAYHTGTNEYFTVPVGLAGYYFIYANLSWQAGADASHEVYIKVNNNHKLMGANQGNGTQVTSCSCQGVLLLAEGDHVDIGACTSATRSLYSTNGGSYAGMFLVAPA